ncbi:MAG: AMP-binding protein, partial [Sulfitobacter geojensis]
MARVEAFLADQVAVRADAMALTDSIGTAWSFADLDRASDALADVLRAAGVSANDRVLMLSENCAAAVAALFACWKMDAVVIPVNARQTEGEVKRIMDHATPAAVLMTSAVSKDALQHAERMGATEQTGAFGSMHLAALPSNPDADLHDVATLLYTTGTTGDPKGVMMTHDNMRFGGMASSGLRDMTADDVVYGVLPLTHVFGLVSVITGACYSGATVQQEARFSAKALYDAIMNG